MTSGFDVELPADDDYAGMLASLEQRLDGGTIARAIGVRESELDLIRIGRAPSKDAAERLAALYDLARRTDGDLADPRTLLAAAGMETTEGDLMVPISLVPRLKTLVVGFLVLDALVFGAVVLVVALRS